MIETKITEFSVKDLIRVIRVKVRLLFSNWLILLLASIVAGLIGVLYSTYQKPVFKATLTFVTDNSSEGQASSYSGLAAQFGFNLGGNASVFSGDNLTVILKSKTIIINTLLSKSYNGKLLIENYISNHELDKIIRKKLGHAIFFGEKNKDRASDSIISDISKNILNAPLEVERVDNSLDLIYIEMNDINEVFAKNFVEALCDNTISYYAEYKSRKSRENLSVLQFQADSLRSMLFGNINDIASVSDLNVNPLRQQMKTGVQKKQVDLQVNAALYSEVLKQIEIAKIVLRNNTPLIQVIDHPMIPLPFKRFGKLITAAFFSFVSFSLAVVIILIRDWYLKNR